MKLKTSTNRAILQKKKKTTNEPFSRPSIYCCYCLVAQVLSDSLQRYAWTAPCQAPLSMGFSWQEYWNGLPFPPPGDLSDLGIKSMPP